MSNGQDAVHFLSAYARTLNFTDKDYAKLYSATIKGLPEAEKYNLTPGDLPGFLFECLQNQRKDGHKLTWPKLLSMMLSKYNNLVSKNKWSSSKSGKVKNPPEAKFLALGTIIKGVLATVNDTSK